MSLALDRIQTGSHEQEDSDLDYKILSIQIIKQAINDFIKSKKFNLMKMSGRCYDGSSVHLILECERFLFDREGEWAESRILWLTISGIEPSCFDQYLIRVKKKMEKYNGKH